MKTLLTLTALLVATLAGAAGWAWFTRDAEPVSILPFAEDVAKIPDGERRPAHADPALVETGRYGPLPRRGEDGREPRRTYARPFSASATTPRIAVVITDLGLRRAQTAAVIRDLPGVVTLAFSPYGTDLPALARAARAEGHEILLDLPLAPRDTEREDTGPRMITPALSAASNVDRLHWTMSRITGYVGLLGGPSALGPDDETMRAVLTEIGDRGLFYVPASIVLRLDDEPSEARIDDRFAEAEAEARRTGRAVVVGEPYALTLRKVKEWIDRADEAGIAVAPISAVVTDARSGP